MDDAKFKMEVALVVKLLEIQRKLNDESDRRVLRDIIRAIVKELTRV